MNLTKFRIHFFKTNMMDQQTIYYNTVNDDILFYCDGALTIVTFPELFLA